MSGGNLTKEQYKAKTLSMKQAAIEYASGTPIQTVMKKYNVSYASVYNAIKRFDIPYEGRSNRRVFFDESYFTNIDTEDKAYWLGYIYADGNVNTTDNDMSKPNRLTLNASGEDGEHLRKFMKDIQYTGELRFQIQPKSYSETPSYRVQCNSIKLVSDLMHHGCMPNKTSSSHLPPLTPEMLRHFIRGYFDGDGCISPTNRVGEFSITSEPNILLEIQQVLMKELGLSQTKLKTYKHTTVACSLRYGGRANLSKLYDYMYSNATIYMQRKFDKFSLLLSQ
ncbi:hypothetical protein C2I27_03590 [Priestia megaterium]|uniref:LAGLIDADG family homing endonuclease n=1 Tax=Priestia megaterium TaxID=1404 RepID=UPI000D515F08|nr:LAGLIDADG family homing endonuclease [Priestia megaterium]PVC74982.1 hypothetical protein C2I27_03590 [Priestia megaterium]